MKKIIQISILSVIAVSGIMGCGSARMEITNYDTQGKITSVNKIKYTRVGSGELQAVAVDIKEGKASVGSQKGSAGDIGEALKNFSEVAKKGAGIP